MPSLKERLVSVLTDKKYLTKEQLDKCLQISKQKGTQLKDIIVEQGFLSKKQLLGLISEELKTAPFDITKFKIAKEIITIVPERIARQYHLIPISRIGDTLTVAMSDPLNIFALDDLKSLTGYKVDPVISQDADILRAIEGHYRSDMIKISEILDSQEEEKTNIMVVDEERVDIADILQESQRAPIVKIVDLFISEGLRRRCSDIHVEPTERDLRVRYRIDGVLHEALILPKKNQNAVLARLKIMSGLDITEARLAQDGRFKIRMQDREVDFRVSALPTTFGQKFVLRALDKSNLSVGLDALGFTEGPLNLFKEAIAKPFGMILVTGPTGSGKSTTLYSILTKINTAERNIITIEDPVEYQVEGITQIQVKPEIGLTFASGLRSLLRQSPDIIMIGEVRDSETADIAVRAALTGQLVFSTLHTNDAPGAMTRLIDMGVEPFLVASSVIMVCAQRLCRRICNACKEPEELDKSVLERLGIKEKTFYRGKGCNRCNNTGYFGRVAIIEAFPITDEIRDLIIKKSSADLIKDYAIKHMNFKTLWDDALVKLTSGIITLEEMLRVTTEE
ncbi:MAG: ATPase, T2SS/T4P/T4SS family [Candidatus Omnitrophota bacterium]